VTTTAANEAGRTVLSAAC